MKLSNENLLLGAGAVMALVGVSWMLSRKKAVPYGASFPALPSPPAESAQPKLSTGSAPKPVATISPHVSSGLAQSKFRLGMSVRTTGPYAEIGYRTQIGQPNIATLKRGAPAGMAKGLAIRSGAHIFEALSFEGKTIYIVQSLLEAIPVTAKTGPGVVASSFSQKAGISAKVTFAPTAQYVLSRVSPGFAVTIRSNLSHNPLGKVDSNVLVGMLKRTTSVSGASYYVVDVKDAFLDVRISAQNARIVSGETLTKLVAAGEVKRWVDMQPLGQSIATKPISAYFSFLSGINEEEEKRLGFATGPVSPMPRLNYLNSPTPLRSFLGRA